MNSKEFIREFIENPFPESKTNLLFHATTADFKKFRRETHGIYVTSIREYAMDHYGGVIIPLYANVTNLFEPGYNARELDWVYDRDYIKVQQWLSDLSNKGYDAVKMYGDGDSIILIGDVTIINAVNSNNM